MPLINRFTTVTKGSMVLTGNTLNISAQWPYPAQINEDNLSSAYISLDTTLQVPIFTSPLYPLGTTELSRLSSSSATLNIPDNSTILYAQLFWTMADSVTLPNTPINFISSTSTAHSITPDTLLNQNGTDVLWRGADVRSIVANDRGGIYSVATVPGPTLNSTMGVFPCPSAWYLLVVYENSSFPFRYMNVNTGLDMVTTNADYTISGFATPSTGTTIGYLLQSASYGDIETNAQLLLGPNLAGATAFGNTATNTWNNVAPYAQINNMYISNILIADPNDPNISLLDTRGTLGDNNKNPFAGTSPSYVRNNANILGFDISQQFAHNQNSLFSRIQINSSTSTKDLYMTSHSLQVDINAANLSNIIQTVNQNLAAAGETLHYTISISNTGTADAQNVILMDTIPTYTSFVNGSVYVNGINYPLAAPTLPGISLPTISAGQTTTVTFSVVVGATVPPGIVLTNNSQVTYNFSPGGGMSTIHTGDISNTTTTTLTYASFNGMSKSCNKTYAQLGDILTFTITLPNSGDVTAYNVVLIDTIPSGTTFISNSLTINGITQTGKSPAPPLGLTLGTIGAGSSSIITFQVSINN